MEAFLAVTTGIQWVGAGGNAKHVAMPRTGLHTTTTAKNDPKGR